MRGIKLCTTPSGDLVGMQAYVGEYSTRDNVLLTTHGMNKIGSVRGARCSTMFVDPLRGEYVSKFAFRIGKSSIVAISVQTSLGNYIYKGDINKYY